MSDMLFSLSEACSSFSPLAIGLAAGCRVFSILRALLYHTSFIMPNALTYFHLVRCLYLRFSRDLLWSLNLHVAALLECNLDALQRVLMCFPNLALTAVQFLVWQSSDLYHHGASLMHVLFLSHYPIGPIYDVCKQPATLWCMHLTSRLMAFQIWSIVDVQCRFRS